MGTYKLIALDMDGTLLNEDKKISDENREAIQQATALGKTVIMSTGRGAISAMPYIEELGLNTPLVVVNGSEVWESPTKLHKRTLLATETVRNLHTLAQEHDCWWWAYSVDQGVFNRESEQLDIEGQAWLKFGFYTENPEKLQRIRGIVENWGILEITNSHPSNIELNPRGISKASGVEMVCQLLGIQMSEVIAMGDSENDITMIREAGLGVAMGNAQDEVKRIADVTTVTNEEHAVAKVIRTYMLQD
ncbi:5-amino-6-(5-phospho-D-ribitylamino)uracil phosphatase YcsE [Paenibacillus marchantiophytorum]|uniref:5-amino-6-(5-phospho-D-ribitylamino)uracil phosphatase YcsE n=1 Tax=Paenibacillus marchantiophytorum TaxID=1619310 RepID=A0ABQ1EL29_9BACL|nr:MULTISPECIES: Cof-type HAD-IIB family hydrolase [Paenibacillus]UKS27493.1 Cof-type HAD-IIB family hydrolase [Paenibacillus sp. HWE-109]GFZ76798.1 5-amino-6-(5-phospho-D-ribitylamino)uracil phosphatase YcsE [Paenibacillus marchantiophytorum]